MKELAGGAAAVILVFALIFSLVYGVWWALLAIVWWAFNITTPLLWTYPIGAAVVSMVLGSIFKRGK